MKRCTTWMTVSVRRSPPLVVAAVAVAVVAVAVQAAAVVVQAAAVAVAAEGLRIFKI